VLSPDGRRLAFVRTLGVAVQDIYVMSVAGGEPARLTSDNLRIFGLTWNPRNNRILFSSGRSAGARIWSISPAGGEPQRLAGGFGESAAFLAISRAGDRLAYSRILFDTNIWRYPMPGTGAEGQDPVRLVSSTRLEQGPKFSPDGERITFASNRGGSPEIWLGDGEGANAVQLTSFDGPATGSPFWSPDGREIVFDSRPNGNPDIYVVSTQGGAPRRITTEPSQDVVPSWSRDGKSIYFASNRSGRFEVWKAPAQGGAAIQVTRHGGFHGFESPDGKYLYYAKSTVDPGLWRVPASGGREEPVLESLRGGFWAYWTLSGQRLFYLDRGETEAEGIRYYLRRLDLESGQDRLIMRMPKRPFNSGLSISPDGKWILYTQVDQSDTDIMLVDDFRE
jgi:Tol biopolymer transport system component